MVNKAVMNALKEGAINYACVYDGDASYFKINIQLNIDYSISFYFYDTVRKFEIYKRMPKDNWKEIYSNYIVKEDFAEFDYLMTSRSKEFLNKELEKAFVNDELLTF